MSEVIKNFALHSQTKPIDIRETDWFRPLNYSILNNPIDGDLAQYRFDTILREVMTEQGHTYIRDPRSFSNGQRLDILVTYENIPVDRRLIKDRISEHKIPLALVLTTEYQLNERPENLFTVITIPERLSNKSHSYVVELIRTAAARIGTPRITFLSADKQTGDIYEITNGTLEGGHDTTVVKNGNLNDAVKASRDRMVAIGNTEVVGNKYKINADKIDKDFYDSLQGPDFLIAAGERMDDLRLLPEPKNVSDYVSPGLAKIYNKFLNMGSFSEGMLFVRDPRTGLIMTTASGSWNVDKRHLKRNEVSILTGVDDKGYLQVAGVKGVKGKGPSVEALEMYLIMEKYTNIRAGLHSHIGINDVDERIVEWLLANPNYIHGFCCGTRQNASVSLDSADRSLVVTGKDPSRAVVMWFLKYHGIVAIEVENDKTINSPPFKHLLDVFDPKAIGAVMYDPNHIHQKDLI